MRSAALLATAAAALLLCAPLFGLQPALAQHAPGQFAVDGEDNFSGAGVPWGFRVYLGAAPIKATRFAENCVLQGQSAVTAEATWTAGQVDATGYRRAPITLPAFGVWTCAYVFETIVQGGTNTPSTQYRGGSQQVHVAGVPYYSDTDVNGPEQGQVATPFVLFGRTYWNPVVATTVFVRCTLGGGAWTDITNYPIVEAVNQGLGMNVATVNFNPPTFGTWSCKFEPMGDASGNLAVASAQYLPSTVTFVIRSAPSTVTFPTDVLIGSAVAIDLTPGLVPDKLTDISIVCTGTPFGASTPVVKTATPASWDPANNAATQHSSVTFDQVAQYTCVISFTTGSAPNVVLSLDWSSQTVLVTAHRPLIYLNFAANSIAVHTPLQLYVSRGDGAADVFVKIACGVNGAAASVLAALELSRGKGSASVNAVDDYTPTQPGHHTCIFQIFDDQQCTTLNTVYGVDNEFAQGDGLGRLQFYIAGEERIASLTLGTGAWTATADNHWPRDQIMLGDVLQYAITLSVDPATLGAGGLNLTVSADCHGSATVVPAVWSSVQGGLTATLQLTVLDPHASHPITFQCALSFSGTAADYFIGGPSVGSFSVSVAPTLHVERTSSVTGSVLPNSAQSVALDWIEFSPDWASFHVSLACDYSADNSRHVIAISGSDLIVTAPISYSNQATFHVPSVVTDVRCTFTRGAAAGASYVWWRMPDEFRILVRTTGAGVLVISEIASTVSRGASPLAISATVPLTVNALGLHLNLTCTDFDPLSFDFAAGTPSGVTHSLSLPQLTSQSTHCAWSIAGDDYFALPSPATFTIQLPAFSLTGVTAQSKFLFGSSAVFTFTTNALNQYAGDDFSIDVECTKGNSGNSGIVAGLAAAGTQVSFTYTAPNATAGSPDTTDSCTFTVVSEAHFTPFFVDAAPEAVTFGLTLTPPVVPQSSSSSSTGPHPPSSSSSSSSSGPPPPPPSSCSSGPSSSSSGPSAPPPPSSSGPSSSSSGASAPPPPATNGTTLSSSTGSGNGGSNTLPGNFENTAAGATQSASVLAMILALAAAVFGAAL